MDFKERVQSMTIKEIVLAMIAGLEREYIKVDMTVYGVIRDGVCFGCAATNAVCEISGVTFSSKSIENIFERAMFLHTEPAFLNYFEIAINKLRLGRLLAYNDLARGIGVALIPEELVREYDFIIPKLTTQDYKQNLHHYKEFAELL